MHYLLFALLACVQLIGCGSGARTFSIQGDTFLLDGDSVVLRSGEIHFDRIPKAYWRHRLQMLRAMGLNTVCTYLFWNKAEPEQDRFDQRNFDDMAEFCRLAQEEGLWVILRPGPYVCAEWDMGGLPWWLLRKEGIGLRSQDPYFLERTRKYLNKVGETLAPLQITQGGPILMVQVENEYGHWGTDTTYLGILSSRVSTCRCSSATISPAWSIGARISSVPRISGRTRIPALRWIRSGASCRRARCSLRSSIPDGWTIGVKGTAGWRPTP